MTQKELAKTLQEHKGWVANGSGRRADFRGADLQHVNFEGADLRFADFRAANLSHARFDRADCRHADFRAANLSHASCIGTDFTKASLDGADMAGVDLRAAKMEFATLAGADTAKGFDKMLADVTKGVKPKEADRGLER